MIVCPEEVTLASRTRWAPPHNSSRPRHHRVCPAAIVWVPRIIIPSNSATCSSRSLRPRSFHRLASMIRKRRRDHGKTATFETAGRIMPSASTRRTGFGPLVEAVGQSADPRLSRDHHGRTVPRRLAEEFARRTILRRSLIDLLSSEKQVTDDTPPAFIMHSNRRQRGADRTEFRRLRGSAQGAQSPGGIRSRRARPARCRMKDTWTPQLAEWLVKMGFGR